MHYTATIYLPGQEPRLLTGPENDILDLRYAFGHIYAVYAAAAALMKTKPEFVDPLDSTSSHLVLACFDHSTGRNKAAEIKCSELIQDDYFGGEDNDSGHLFGPILIIQAF